MSATEIKRATSFTTKQQFVTTYDDGSVEVENAKPVVSEFASREQFQERLKEMEAIKLTDIAVKVDRFMDLLKEVSELGEEIAEEGAAGDTAWHEEYCDDEDGYHEGFLRGVRAIADVCYSMRQQINTFERTKI